MRLLTLVKLIKLFLFANKYSTGGENCIILNKDNYSIFIHNKLLTELRTLFLLTKSIISMFHNRQTDMSSCGLHIINYFHSVLKLIYKIKSSQKEKFEASSFDTELRSLKAFKHHPNEYLLIRSDLLNFIVNFKFINYILVHKTLDLFSLNDFPTDYIISRMSDLLEENTI